MGFVLSNDRVSPQIQLVPANCMYGCIWVLSICRSNSSEDPISMEEVFYFEKKANSPTYCSLLAENLHLTASGPGSAPFKCSCFHFFSSPLELVMNSTGTRCLSKTSYLFICCSEIVSCFTCWSCISAVKSQAWGPFFLKISFTYTNVSLKMYDAEN